MPTVIGRTIGFVCGLFLVIAGFNLLTPQSGLPQNGSTTGLISVLVALGIGVLAASLLPNSITVHGEKLKPLGMNLNASGGAAFFIVTLIFVFYTQEPRLDDAKRDRESPASPTPLPASVDTGASGSPVPAAPSSPSATPVAQVTAPDPEAIGGAASSPGSEQLPNPSANAVRVGSYSHIHCPQGPNGCIQSGWGFAPTFDQAAEIAVGYCVFYGGLAQSCQANVFAY